MKPRTMTWKIARMGWLAILVSFVHLTMAWAAIPVEHIRCKGCHEMMGPTLLPQYQGNEGCINCHSSDTSSTTYELDLGGMGEKITVPVVVYTGTDEPTCYLAGGNFWWVKEGLGSDDTKGHNVFSGEPDDNLMSAPMNAAGCEDGGLCHQNLHEEVFFGANRQGCTKCHMVTSGSGEYGHTTGFHHADDSNTVVGSLTGDTDGFYRYLVGHMSGEGHGVCGIEDPIWEATPSETVHNEYLGFSGTKSSPGNLSVLGHTMTGFCCGCHGYKHESQAVPGGNWIRHPSGVILCPDGLDGCELAGYSTYNPQNPVSRPDLSGGLSDTVAPDTDMAMCLSCHRAHGSPYPKMLRWDTLSGCDDCHTTATQCPE